MGKKIFQPEKYGMVICPGCNGQGYIQAPKRQCCPKCGGFGYVRNEMSRQPFLERFKPQQRKNPDDGQGAVHNHH